MLESTPKGKGHDFFDEQQELLIFATTNNLLISKTLPTAVHETITLRFDKQNEKRTNTEYSSHLVFRVKEHCERVLIARNFTDCCSVLIHLVSNLS